MKKYEFKETIRPCILLNVNIQHGAQQVQLKQNRTVQYQLFTWGYSVHNINIQHGAQQVQLKQNRTVLYQLFTRGYSVHNIIIYYPTWLPAGSAIYLNRILLY